MLCGVSLPIVQHFVTGNLYGCKKENITLIQKYNYKNITK